MGYLKAQRRAFRGGRTVIEPEKLIPLHGNYRHLKSFQVDAGVAIIAAAVTRRRTEARRLGASAGAEWAAAKARFEQELLGNP